MHLGAASGFKIGARRMNRDGCLDEIDAVEIKQ